MLQETVKILEDGRRVVLLKLDRQHFVSLDA